MIRRFSVTELMQLHARTPKMSKFDHERMIEECAEYQEHIEREDSLNALLEEMYDYYRDFANLELLGLHNG